MKHDYSIMVFSANAEENTRILQNRDYHTLCVIQDATGYTPSGTTMAMWVKSGESFPIDPAWPVCKSRAEYAEQGAKLATVKGGAHIRLRLLNNVPNNAFVCVPDDWRQTGYTPCSGGFEFQPVFTSPDGRTLSEGELLEQGIACFRVQIDRHTVRDFTLKGGAQ